MNNLSGQRSWAELVGLSLLSLFLYKVGIFLFLFLIPLQVLYVRYGLRALLYGTGAVLFFIFIFGLTGTRKIENSMLRSSLVLLELSIPAALAGGLVLLNTDYEYLKRKLFRMLAITGAVGLISVIVIISITRNESYMTLIKDQLALFVNQFKETLMKTTPYNESMLSEMFNTDRLFETIKKIILRNYLFIYFLLLAGNWKAGMNIGKKSIGQDTGPFSRFILPEYFIWPLLLSWSGVLLDNYVSLGFFSYLFWNAALIFLFLYGLQGYAIIRFLYGKHNVSRSLRLFTGLGILLFLFIPGLNILVMVGIPGFGVSELWIKYRKEERSN